MRTAYTHWFENELLVSHFIGLKVLCSTTQNSNFYGDVYETVILISVLQAKFSRHSRHKRRGSNDPNRCTGGLPWTITKVCNNYAITVKFSHQFWFHIFRTKTCNMKIKQDFSLTDKGTLKVFSSDYIDVVFGITLSFQPSEFLQNYFKFQWMDWFQTWCVA